jgi:lipase chaperone LimK
MDAERTKYQLEARQKAVDLLEKEVPKEVRRSIVHVYRVLDNQVKVPQLPPDVQANFQDLYMVICWAHKINKRRLNELVKSWKAEFENQL